MSDVAPYTYNSCSDLKQAGIFVNSKYKIREKREMEDCNLWGKYV